MYRNRSWNPVNDREDTNNNNNKKKKNSSWKDTLYESVKIII
jgi:hypothetical protein